jgi:hypothetical protein
MIYHLHRWSVVGSAWVAPEAQTIRLSGFRNQEERKVVTSAVDKIDGRTITTASGSVYILEDIDPDYLNWMVDNNIKYDPDNPIKVRSS